MENNYSLILPIPRLIYYDDISLNDYYSYFTKDTDIGGSISDIILYHKDLKTNNYLRRGGGFWSYVGQLAKRSLPFIHKYLLPEALNVGQTLIEKHQSKGRISKKDLSDISKDTLKRVVKNVVLGSGRKNKQKRNIRKSKSKINIQKNKTRTLKKKTKKISKNSYPINNIFSSI